MIKLHECSNHFKDLRLTLKNFPHHFRGLYSIVLQQSTFKERFCLPKLIATRDTLSLYVSMFAFVVGTKPLSSVSLQLPPLYLALSLGCIPNGGLNLNRQLLANFINPIYTGLF